MTVKELSTKLQAAAVCSADTHLVRWNDEWHIWDVLWYMVWYHMAVAGSWLCSQNCQFVRTHPAAGARCIMFHKQHLQHMPGLHAVFNLTISTLHDSTEFRQDLPGHCRNR